MTPRRRILWQRVDQPGMEWAEIDRTSSGRSICGTVLVATGTPHRIDYSIGLDALGSTRHVTVTATSDETVDLEIVGNGSGGWWVNGASRITRPGCLDIDLGFSPLTNSLPIWRLHLQPRDEASIFVAWLTFPELELVDVGQTYRRLDASTYRFRSEDFEADLRVGPDGLVEEYAGLWRMAAESTRHRDG